MLVRIPRHNAALAAFLLAAMVAVPGTVWAQAADAEALLNARCSACHERLADGGMSRVNEVRKPPEAWDMTIVRMMLLHGVEVTADERRVLVKYLADTQGIAPSEAAPWRYILERRTDVFEAAPDDELLVMCGRCHSYARVALQRRDEDEWLKHSHFHLGQYPTAEYQALGRDRNWWEIASTTVPKALGELYPLETAEWTAWKGQTRDVSGDWRIVGTIPGTGSFEGTMSVSAEGGDSYSLTEEFTLAVGASGTGSGSAILYTGYEWRASIDSGGTEYLEVLALSEDGNTLSGRFFVAASDSVGGEITAVRMGGAAQVLQVEPAYLRAGESGQVAIHGVGLSGNVSLGDGVEVVSTVSADDQTVIVEAKAAGDAAVGLRDVSVGGASGAGLLAVYSTVDSVRVVPEYTIARVGGGGGPLPSVPAQFEAIGYANGADGEAGTDDDVRIGAMPAEWSVANFNETAVEMEDTKYSGAITATGLFDPATAGLNPARPFATNNVGDLAVNAAVTDGGNTVEGSAHLIVTVQRWNDPPIR